MEILSVRFLASDCDLNVITACDEHDTCPGCGAGCKVGMSQCEYCKRPVRYATGGMVPRPSAYIGESGDGCMKLIHPREMVMPASISAYYKHEAPEHQHPPHPEYQQGANA